MMRAFLLLALAVAAQAHEIGTTRVSVLTGQDGYNIEVVTDAAALEEKLATLPGHFDDKFRSRVHLAFDGTEVHPSLEFARYNDGGAIIRLTGKIPHGARAFTWSYGWTFATYALEFRANPSREPVTQWLEGGDQSAPISLSSPPTAHAILDYVRLGFTHIVPEGVDHVLFVLGIFFLGRKARSVLLQVSAFTVAHSITLGLSLYGVVSVAPSIVEPMIALSIAYVAIENVFLSELRPWRIALVFAFGLLHGLGFAGALHELDLPRAQFASALIGFNVGVEAGQLAVIALAFLLVGRFAANREWYRPRVAIPASALIACVAVYWTIERTL